MKEEGNNNAFFKIVNNELAVCLFGIAINIGGAQLAKLLKLPLFLDSIGTVLVAAIGGYLPGVIVGFCSNMINAMNDPANAYYTLLSVLIAVVTAYYSHRGYFEKYYKAILLVFPLSIVGGALGSILTYLIYGFGFGEETFVKLIQDRGLAGLPDRMYEALRHLIDRLPRRHGVLHFHAALHRCLAHRVDRLHLLHLLAGK